MPEATATLKIAPKILFSVSILSFGRSSRSDSFAKEKKERRKKQEFHRHKLRLSEEEKIDLPALKERTILSLDHLGKQQISDDSGGYGFDRWLKNFNMLLDSFEESVGPEKLPGSYFESRREALAEALPQEGNNVASEIREFQEKEKSMEQNLQKMGSKLAHARASSDLAGKIESLSGERATLIDQLEEQRKKLASKKKDFEDSSRIFNRLFSRKKQKSEEVASLTQNVHDLEMRIKGLDQRISELRGRKENAGYRILSDQEISQEFPHQYSELSGVRSKIEELESKRKNDADSSKIRIDMTTLMSQTISKLELAHGAESSVSIDANRE
ncbi:MAG TPA: hypothetical protein VJN71_04315 [Nitrososphaerales archaeon]|nr:hypothetical protein [Nitrososphaerales archaeon]